MVQKLKIIIPMVILLLIFGFSIVCTSESPGSKEHQAVLEEEESTSEEVSEQKDKTESGETETGISKEAEYVLSAGNLITRIGDHISLIGENTTDYDYGDITLEEFKAYLGDFIMMFEESYYPDYLNLEPPVGYEDHYKYIGRFIEHIRRSTEYFQGAIDSEDEDEMLDNLYKALMEIEDGNEWLEEAKKEI